VAARWITFDCYGTLLDWQSGFVAILKTIAAERTGDLLEAYHRNEPKVEGERPFRSYKQVLEISLLRAASEVGIQLTQEQARSLPSQWFRLPVFGDVEEALSQLRSAGYKLGVLTNCDEDLFAQTQRSFKQPFDLVVTAERVRDYKPSLSHFRFFAQTSRVQLADWVHVGCSDFHDIAPAGQLGLKCIWLDRERRSQAHTTKASLRLLTATELPAAVARLFTIAAF
jgi:2-haloacid dehalogenase